MPALAFALALGRKYGRLYNVSHKLGSLGYVPHCRVGQWRVYIYHIYGAIKMVVRLGWPTYGVVVESSATLQYGNILSAIADWIIDRPSLNTVMRKGKETMENSSKLPDHIRRRLHDPLNFIRTQLPHVEGLSIMLLSQLRNGQINVPSRWVPDNRHDVKTAFT